MTRLLIKAMLVSGIVSLLAGASDALAARDFSKADATLRASSTQLARDKTWARQYLANKLVLSAIKLYRETEGRLPEKVADLSNTLFFSVPLDCVKNWRRVGNRLEVSLAFFDSGKKDTVTITFYEPGSPEDNARREKEIQTALSRVIYMTERSYYTKELVPYTVLDVKSGKYPINSRGRFRLYSRNDAEYRQLIWASALATAVREALSVFQLLHGRYPESANELFSFVGQRNDSAWVSPITKKFVGISEIWNGKDFFYRASVDKQGYEFRIPLFGAGLQEPMDSKARQWSKYIFPGNGYLPGDSIRLAKGMRDVEDSYVISPW